MVVGYDHTGMCDLVIHGHMLAHSVMLTNFLVTEYQGGNGGGGGGGGSG